MKTKIKKALKLLLKFDGEQDKCSFCWADDWSGDERIHPDCPLGKAIKILKDEMNNNG